MQTNKITTLRRGDEVAIEVIMALSHNITNLEWVEVPFQHPGAQHISQTTGGEGSPLNTQVQNPPHRPQGGGEVEVSWLPFLIARIKFRDANAHVGEINPD